MGSKIKVAQNVLRHILALEFLKSDNILEIRKKNLTVHKQTAKQTHRHKSEKISCSVRLKNPQLYVLEIYYKDENYRVNCRLLLVCYS